MLSFWNKVSGAITAVRLPQVIYPLCLLVCSSLVFFPPIHWLSLKILDESFQLQRWLTPEPIKDDVVVIGIDEETYQFIPEPFALWHAHLGKLFQALAVGKPSVVGLDFSFPDRSYDTVLPGSDKKLLTGMLALKQVAPLIISITIDETGKTRQVYPPFLSVAGKDAQAFVLWSLDKDRVVRQYKPMLDLQGKALPTLAGSMAKYQQLDLNEGYIDFSIGEKINYIPLQQLLTLFDQQDFAHLQRLLKDKAIVIGTVLPFEDRHYQPVNLAAWEQENRNYVPGLLIHVQALRSLMHKGFIKPISKAYELGLIVLISLLWRLKLDIWQNINVLLLLILAFTGIELGLLHLGYFLPVAALLLSAFITLNSRLIYDISLLIIERRRLKSVFSGYVSPHVMHEIIQGRIKPGVHGELKTICVMFSDIRSFTTISEKLQPEQVISFLNKYLDAMVNAIQQHDGTIDKFMGDGIMAFFGAPAPLGNPCQNAFAAAKAKLTALTRLNKQLQGNHDFPQLQIGIGLHVGEVVVGNIGSTQRNEYTAIGDVINTGSRLEGLTKQLGYPLVVSAEVLACITEKEEFDNLGEVPIKGRAPVLVFGWPTKNLTRISP